MKRFITLVLAGTMLLGTACQSPYAAGIHSLNRAYAAGQVSDREYHREMSRLQSADATWHREAESAVAGAVALGILAVGVAALHDSYHHRHYHGHGCYSHGYHGYGCGYHGHGCGH